MDFEKKNQFVVSHTVVTNSTYWIQFDELNYTKSAWWYMRTANKIRCTVHS